MLRGGQHSNRLVGWGSGDRKGPGWRHKMTLGPCRLCDSRDGIVGDGGRGPMPPKATLKGSWEESRPHASPPPEFPFCRVPEGEPPMSRGVGSHLPHPTGTEVSLEAPPQPPFQWLLSFSGAFTYPLNCAPLGSTADAEVQPWP